MPSVIQSANLAIEPSASLRKAHSQTTATRQPARSNACSFLRSRATFTANFACQNSVRVLGTAA